MPDKMTQELATIDWVLIGAYFAVVMAIGFYFARRATPRFDFCHYAQGG